MRWNPASPRLPNSFLPYLTVFDLPSLKSELEELELHLSDTTIWNNPEYAATLSKKLSDVQHLVNSHQQLKSKLELLELALAEKDNLSESELRFT